MTSRTCGIDAATGESRMFGRLSNCSSGGYENNVKIAL